LVGSNVSCVSVPLSTVPARVGVTVPVVRGIAYST